MSDPISDPLGDRIELRGLRVLGLCGVLPEEQVRTQPLEVDLDVGFDQVPAAKDDDLVHTVDYGALCDAVCEAVTSKPSALLEHLAHRLAEVVLNIDERIDWATVAVRKLRPPVPHDLNTAGVRITRKR